MAVSKCDSAVSVFSPDGHIFQVENAQKAVERALPVVGVRGKNIVVLAAEKKPIGDLQVDRTAKKIFLLDDHVAIACVGISSDARILIDRARIECKNHQLTVQDPVLVEYITRFIAELKQLHTQSSGRRPFGIASLLAGFDLDGTPRLFQTNPSGIYHEWKASAIGRNGTKAHKFLERNYCTDLVSSDEETIRLAIKALLEVAQGTNLEVACLRRGQTLKILDVAEINEFVTDIEEGAGNIVWG